MKKLIVISFVSFLTVFSAGVIIGAAQKLEPKTFKSQNGEYVVTVEYEDWLSKGKAHYIIKNKGEKKLNVFNTDISPYNLCISNDGQRIVVLGGDWAEKVIIDKIAFYDFRGNMLGVCSVKITVPGGTAISEDGKCFVFGYQYRGKKVLSMFNLNTGRMDWEVPLEIYPHEVLISDKGEWIIIHGSGRKIILFNKEGKKYWEEVLQDIKKIQKISLDGTSFEVEEKSGKKRIYKNIEGKVNLEKIVFLGEGEKDMK